MLGRARGLPDILDCRIEWTDEEWVSVAAPGIGYTWLVVDDAGQQMPEEWFEIGTRHVRQRLDAGGSLLVHCHMGINRGPSMGFAAMLDLGSEPVDALARIRERRPIAHIDYAEDALEWWQRKNGAPPRGRAKGRRLVAEWRRDHNIDVATIIRQIRLKDGA